LELQPSGKKSVVVAKLDTHEATAFAGNGFSYFSRLGHRIMKEAIAAYEEHRVAEIELTEEQLLNAATRLRNQIENRLLENIPAHQTIRATLQAIVDQIDAYISEGLEDRCQPPQLGHL
jgi:hypothetical protein